MSNTRKQLFRLTAAGAALVSVLAACSSSNKSSTAGGSGKYAPIPAGPIVFGLSAPLSGSTAAYGLETQISFNKATLPAFNATYPNGIDGHPIQIKILDDASDVTKAVSVAQQLVADHVAAVLTISYNPPPSSTQCSTRTRCRWFRS
jgi:ABC-type branched-subunit amino acid transport system substrate-binding protein